MGCEIGVCGWCGYHFDFGKRACEEGLKAQVATERDGAADAKDFRHETCKHDLVDDALLAPEEQTAGGEVLAGPERLRVGAHGRGVVDRLPAGLVGAPALSEVAALNLRQ